MGVHTATRFDKAVFGRNGVAKHMLDSSRWTNVCLEGFCRLSFQQSTEYKLFAAYQAINYIV